MIGAASAPARSVRVSKFINVDSFILLLASEIKFLSSTLHRLVLAQLVAVATEILAFVSPVSVNSV